MLCSGGEVVVVVVVVVAVMQMTTVNDSSRQKVVRTTERNMYGSKRQIKRTECRWKERRSSVPAADLGGDVGRLDSVEALYIHTARTAAPQPLCLMPVCVVSVAGTKCGLTSVESIHAACLLPVSRSEGERRKEGQGTIQKQALDRVSD